MRHSSPPRVRIRVRWRPTIGHRRRGCQGRPRPRSILDPGGATPAARCWRGNPAAWPRVSLYETDAARRGIARNVEGLGGIMRRSGFGRWSAIAVVGMLTGFVQAGPAVALEVGQKAPDFSLPAPGGKQVKLSDLTAKGPVVLYTFIQAF